jgi:hypothetical protein
VLIGRGTERKQSGGTQPKGGCQIPIARKRGYSQR